ncbi:MAG: hypothetical protein HYZ09_00975 [Candidatus Kerfeldbacteria bacterium]|nr:hypothetical protein [Candidatus Kerfeldbacteria bacterium]
MKKLIAVVSLVAVAGFGFAVSASEGWVGGDTNTNVIVTNENSAYIKTDAKSEAETGENKANADSAAVGGSSRAKGGMIETGDADATTEVAVVANTNETEINVGCGCEGGDGDTHTNLEVHNANVAKVKTKAKSEAETGDNEANASSAAVGGSSRARGGMIMTGAASAWTAVGVIANTNWTLINHP